MIWYTIYDMIYSYLLTAVGLILGGSSTVHIYTQNNTMKQQNNTTRLKKQHD